MGVETVFVVLSLVLVVALGVAVFGLVTARGERRRAEASLRVFQKAIDTLPIEVTVKTLDGRILYSNPAGRKLHGYEAEELVGCSASLLAPAALAPPIGEAEALVPASRERPREGGDGHGEGTPFPMQLRSSVVRSDDGQPLAIVTTAEEITERKDGEREARRLRSALESAFEGIALVGEDQRLWNVSRAFADLFGARAEELEGRMFRDLVLPADSALLSHGLSRMEKAGKGAAEVRFRRADGICFRGEAMLIRPRAEGIGREHYVFVRDVSVRADREEAVRISETRFRMLTESSPDAVMTLDDSGGIAFRNRRTEELFCDSGGTLGTPKAEELLAPECRDSFTRSLAEITANGGSGMLGIDQEISGLRRNGTKFPCELAIAVVTPGGNGRRVEDQASTLSRSLRIRDVSAQRQVRDGLLERTRAEERTAALEISNRELEQYGSVVSHDLQEPLRKIRYFGERLKSRHGDALPPEAAEMLERMIGASIRMQSLVRDLFEYSQAGAHPPAVERTDLSVAFADVTADLELRLRESGAELVAEGDLPMVPLAPVEARKILQNLVGNALKFRRPDVPARVVVSAAVERGSVRIEVADNGAGFDPRHTERIFGVFERLVGREVPGSGIGLPVCRKIARRHGGDVTATSVPGEGSRFVVTLPAAAVVAQGVAA